MSREKGGLLIRSIEQLYEVSKRTASDDLRQLEAREVLKRVGTTGKGTHYRLKGQ